MNLMSDYIQNKGNDDTYQQLHNIATAINEVLKVVGSDDLYLVEHLHLN